MEVEQIQRKRPKRKVRLAKRRTGRGPVRRPARRRARTVAGAKAPRRTGFTMSKMREEAKRQGMRSSHQARRSLKDANASEVEKREVWQAAIQVAKNDKKRTVLPRHLAAVGSGIEICRRGL